MAIGCGNAGKFREFHGLTGFQNLELILRIEIFSNFERFDDFSKNEKIVEWCENGYEGGL
jgi:hypothetical protein